jgi:putative membrane protein
MAILTEEENRAVAAAVAEAEKTTGGEIATAVIAESDDYGFRELVVSLLVGAVAFVIIAQTAPALETLLQRWFWNYELWMLPVAVAVPAILIGVVTYLLLQLPGLDRLVISRAAMAEAVARRARRHFMESGVYDTVDRTGVLIFVSMLEHRVELIADRGITKKVPQEAWDSVVADLTAGIAAGQIGEALVAAVRTVGTILSDKVQPREDNTNELSNRPVELERGS